MNIYPHGAWLFAWAFNRHCGWYKGKQYGERAHNAEYEACDSPICCFCYWLSRLLWNSEEAA